MRLSDDDRDMLARIIETTIGLGGIDHPDCRLCGRDIPCPTHTARAAVFNIRPTVESIVQRAVNEALTEAADAIEAWQPDSERADEPGSWKRGVRHANLRAADIVRTRTTA